MSAITSWPLQPHAKAEGAQPKSTRKRKREATRAFMAARITRARSGRASGGARRDWRAPHHWRSDRDFVVSSQLLLGGDGLGHGFRDAVDRLQNARDDLVGIAFGIRAAIFEIALVTLLDEMNRQADRGAAIG